MSESFIKDLFFDKYYSKQNRKQYKSGEEYWVFTGTTPSGYERHWTGTESELEREKFNDFYRNIGKIAGPFRYRKAGFDYCEKKGISTPVFGDNPPSEWSPEKKAEQEKIRAEIAIRNELLYAAKKSACDIFNSQTAGKVGLFKPGVTVRMNYTMIANGMKAYLHSDEAKMKLSAFFRNGGKEKDVRGAIYGGYKYVEQRLDGLKRNGY